MRFFFFFADTLLLIILSLIDCSYWTEVLLMIVSEKGHKQSVSNVKIKAFLVCILLVLCDTTVGIVRHSINSI